jgi:hypothetical protein
VPVLGIGGLNGLLGIGIRQAGFDFFERGKHRLGAAQDPDGLATPFDGHHFAGA